jgi:tRNA A-37 threonylcarbamoyl transferase component Bud32
MDTTDRAPGPHGGSGPSARSHETGRRRRPSGEPPPLPRDLGRSGRFMILMVAYFASVLIGIFVFAPLQRLFDQADAGPLRWVASIRTPWITEAALGVNLLASRWTIRILRWGAILGLVVFKRWRHLLVFLGSALAVEAITYQVSLYVARPRPLGIEVLAPWNGFSMPSRPLAGLAVTLIGIAYALVVPGVNRSRAKWAIGVALGTLVLARIYLAVDQPSSAIFGAVFGLAVGVCAFRWFAPNDIFPVTYRRAKAAHLDVGGRRGQAIQRAIHDQLGLTVVDVKPVGLEGSGGSTPLRLRVAADAEGPERPLFAKLYAKNHVRADRWYKLGRTILYGALEDETSFQSVRRFVEYEDYTLRLMSDLGLPVPLPYGVVEITPEREYMIVMEFFDSAVEISEADVDERVIDAGLGLVRRMWDAGLAHRDVKPANLMVRDGDLRLIDVFFVQVRPSPWRQAVDLANMMMVLALRSDAPRVYERALNVFTADEIAEAFAAARGVASPTQLRAMMKQEKRDLLAEFRALAPPRKPVAIQRWSIRRIGLTAAVVTAAAIAVLFVVSNWAVFA